MKITSNIPNNGLCVCGYPLDANGVCTNPSCPTADAYTAGYRAPILTEQYPIEDEVGFGR